MLLFFYIFVVVVGPVDSVDKCAGACGCAGWRGKESVDKLCTTVGYNVEKL
jgi:hypothetical protein